MVAPVHHPTLDRSEAMNATNDFRELTAEEMQSVEGGSLLGDAIRKIGDLLSGSMEDGLQKSRGTTRPLSSEPPPNL
jgi:bacteriocin-like protein